MPIPPIRKRRWRRSDGAELRKASSMKKILVCGALVCALAVGTGAIHAQTPGDKPAVVKIDPSFDALVSPDARLELVKTGFGFVEGIVWVRKKDEPGYLLLSDMPANVIF